MGAQLIKKFPLRQHVAGDGTTTAAVLAQAIIKEGLKNVAAGANPMALKEESPNSGSGVEEPKNLQTQIERNCFRRQQFGDDRLSETLFPSHEKVGKDGVITVDESKP